MSREGAGFIVMWTGSWPSPSQPSRDPENAAPYSTPGSRATPPPRPSTRVKPVPSNRSVTPSGRPAITRSPKGAPELAQAKLREGPLGSCWGSV